MEFQARNENVGKKRAAKMPHPNEIFGISISLLPIGCALLNNEPSALAINVADETFWLAGYGR